MACLTRAALVPKRFKKILPAGALLCSLWAWEANTEFEEVAGQTWLILLPIKYNKQVHYGWRLDPKQISQDRAAAAAAAASPAASATHNPNNARYRGRCNEPAPS